jgi:hypothetical protein
MMCTAPETEMALHAEEASEQYLVHIKGVYVENGTVPPVHHTAWCHAQRRQLGMLLTM